MAENNPNAETSVPVTAPLNLLEISGVWLRPELPRAIPMTMKYEDGTYRLIGLRFESVAEAENFAKGLEKFCNHDGKTLFLKKPPPITRNTVGDCFGIN